MPSTNDNYIGPVHWWLPFVVFAGTVAVVLSVAGALLALTGVLHFCHG